MAIDEKSVRKNYERLTKLLIDKKLTIATMESATAGQIASLITDTEGSSRVFKGALVTYCNEAKIKYGVPAAVIERFSVYSKEAAEAMARACREAFNTDIGIGITGTMGNVDPFNEKASVPGTVYFAIDYQGKVESFFGELMPENNRIAYKLAVAELVVEKMKLI